MKNKRKKRSGKKTAVYSGLISHKNLIDFWRAKNFRFLCMLLAVAAAIAAAFLLQPNGSGPSEDEIAARISKFDLPEGRPWITKIENAEEQARLYPALFSGTMDGQYALRYETLFAVYDYREDKIVKIIPIMSINISQ